MKKGDVVYCIKDVGYLDRISHKEGNEYLIISFRKQKNESYVYIKADSKIMQNDYLGFFFDGKKDFCLSWLDFSDYFVTKKQCRLLKLKKLKNYEKSSKEL
jgi:hypothetical protein